jgi:hypothetical protein
MPVSLFVATTEACTTTAPVESFTVPAILPPMPGAANTDEGQNATRKSQIKMFDIASPRRFIVNLPLVPKDDF